MAAKGRGDRIWGPQIDTDNPQLNWYPEILTPLKGMRNRMRLSFSTDVESGREREYGREGVPVGVDDLQAFDRLAADLEVDPLR